MITYISGLPRAGKTTLARQLAKTMEIIHLDQVAIMAGIRRPDLLPPGIATDDIHVASELSLKIGEFTTHLARIHRLDVLLEEFKWLVNARGSIKVVEGNVLPLLRDDLIEFLGGSIKRSVLVDLDGKGGLVNGDYFPRDDVLGEVRRCLDRGSFKHF